MNVGEMQRKLSCWSRQRLDIEDRPLLARREDLRLFDLYQLLYDRDWLRLAYEYVAQNKGSRTAGCDGIDMRFFDKNVEGNLDRLAEELRTQQFRPYPVRRTFIPKKSGKLRPLGIPTVRDRIVQEALRMALEPIFEVEFYRYSFGFRPNRSTHDALAVISSKCLDHAKYFWAIEGDVRACFDEINHDILMRLIRRRIRDKKLLRLIWRFLRAGVVDKHSLTATVLGTPQGGIASPLLANVYLHEFDRFMAQVADLGRKTRERRRDAGQPNFVHIRYADDFVVLCNGTRADAEAMRERIRAFLAERLKLTLSLEKTKITHVNDGFEFLGYRIQRGVTSSGKKLPKFFIPRDACRSMRRKIIAITAPSTHACSVRAKIQALNVHLRGWANYYRYAYNASRVFAAMDHFAFWRMAHWLGRKYRCSMPRVMRRYKRRVNGHVTLGVEAGAVFRIFSIKRDQLRSRTFPNPYELPQADLVREFCYATGRLWTGHEDRPGITDLRWLVLCRDLYRCRNCGREVTEDTAEVDHIRPVRRYRRPIDANVKGNLQTLCIECHRAKTQTDRQMESRMQ
jgi:RNA-directed DNA polymerase